MAAKWVIKLTGYLPPSLNDYSRSRHTRVAAVPRLVKLLEPWASPLSDLKVPRCVGKRVVLINLTYPQSARREMDPDNVTKVIKDALKNTGLLIDDSAKWCECPEPTSDRGLIACTTITLVDVPNTAESVTGCGDFGGYEFATRAAGGAVEVLAREIATGKLTVVVCVDGSDVPTLCTMLRTAMRKAS